MIHILQPSALSVNKHTDACRPTSTRILCAAIGWLVAENQLAVYLLAAMFKGNVTLPSVYLSQKWVSGGINIHYTENDEKSGNIPSLSTHQWSRCRALRACMELKRVFKCTNAQLLMCAMQAVGVQLNISLSSLKIICGRACVSVCVCGRVVDSSELKE